MKVKFMHEASIVNIFEPRDEYCARCIRKNDCQSALVLLDYHGVRSEACASHIPRVELEKAYRLGDPVFFDNTGRIALEKFES